MKNNHFSYNHSDIQRYVNGEMNAAEMRRMELAALDDPFLADALEGHLQADAFVSQNHLDEIRKRLTGKENKTRVVPFTTRYKWLSVAAAVLIVAGAAWFSMNIQEPKQEQLAVRKTPIDSLNAKDTTRVSEAEKAKDASSETADLKNADEEQRRQVAIAKVNTKPLRAPAARQPEVVSSPEFAPVTAQTAPPPVALEKEARSAERKKADNSLADRSFGAKEIIGTVRDQAGNSVPNATVNLGKNRILTTDLNGAFVIPNADSIMTAEITAVGMQPRKIQLRNGDNNIQLEKSEMTLSEVVVTGYGIQRKRLASSGLSAKLDVDTTLAKAPKKGWNAFKRKMSDYLRKEDFDTQSGSMTISFTVRKNGKLHDIETEETDNEELSESIIAFLRSEDFWSPSEERIRLVLRIK